MIICDISKNEYFIRFDEIALNFDYHAKNTPKIIGFGVHISYLCRALKYIGKMAVIELRLSQKVQKETGRSEILIRMFEGSSLNVRAKSGIYVSPEHFEYFIDRKKTVLMGVNVPDKAVTATMKDALKNGYVVFDRGDVFVRNRAASEDKTYHDNAKKRFLSKKAMRLQIKTRCQAIGYKRQLINSTILKNIKFEANVLFST